MKWVSLIAVLIVAACFLGIGYRFLRVSGSDLVAKVPSGQAQTRSNGTGEYRNQKFHFSITYPPAFTVAEFKDRGESVTIVLTDTVTEKSLQIFAVSYPETYVTAQRFKLDEPSGVRTDSQQITLAGAQGEMFMSVDAQGTEIREIWLIKDGYLYEIATLKGDDEWLSSMLKGFSFI